MITTESNQTTCVSSSDHRQGLQKDVWIQQCEKKASGLSNKRSCLLGPGTLHQLGGFIPSVMFLGQRLGASQGLYSWKGEELIKPPSFTVKDATGRSTKAVPQTATPFVTYEHHSLFALFQSEDCPCWGWGNSFNPKKSYLTDWQQLISASWDLGISKLCQSTVHSSWSLPSRKEPPGKWSLSSNMN